MRDAAELELGISYLGDEIGPFQLDHHVRLDERVSPAQIKVDNKSKLHPFVAY